jgi:hypothetical protein
MAATGTVARMTSKPKIWGLKSFHGPISADEAAVHPCAESRLRAALSESYGLALGALTRASGAGSSFLTAVKENILSI